jgi:hypothetical protein
MTVPFTNVSNSATISTTERSLPANTTTSVPTSQTTAMKKSTLAIDRSAMAAGDELKLRVYEKVNGGTQRVMDTYVMNGTGLIDYFELPALGEGWDITLIKTLGTDRAIAWSIREDVGEVSVASVASGYVIPAKLFTNTALDDEGEVWPRAFKTSESTAARRRVYFYMLSNASSGNLSAYFSRQAVGATTYASAAALCNGSGTAQISKNGGVAANVAGTFAEVDNGIAPGLFSYEFTAGELDTPGYVTLFLGGSSGNPKSRAFNVSVVAQTSSMPSAKG